MNLTADQKLHMLIGAYAVQIIVLETKVQQLEAELKECKIDKPLPDAGIS